MDESRYPRLMSVRMEFGKVPNVDGIQWDLPPEDPHTLAFLQKFAKSGTSRTQFFIGAPAWGHKEWVGRLYPPGTSASHFLFQYSRNFNCIELNTTHYRIPTSSQIAKWVESVPENFLFCPKIPKVLSHEPGGMRDRNLLQQWIQAIEQFGTHLGPCFLQLPPYFDYSRKGELFAFLTAWPAGHPLTLELRHSSWFQHGQVLPALVEYLQTRNIGLVITDVAGRRDVLHTSMSASDVMLRFVGNDLHPSDFTRATTWAKRLSDWQRLGLPRIFFIVHEPDDRQTPEMASYVIEELNRLCNAGLTPLARPLIQPPAEI